MIDSRVIMPGPSLEFPICDQDSGRVPFLSLLKCRPVTVSAVNEEGVYLMRFFEMHINNFNLLFHPYETSSVTTFSSIMACSCSHRI